MGSGGVAIAALPTVICLKVPFSDGLGGDKTFICFYFQKQYKIRIFADEFLTTILGKKPRS